MNQKSEKISKLTWVLSGIAIIAAASPHFFFQTPRELHMMANEKAWMGITVWAPAILGGMGFFLNAQASSRFELDPKFNLYAALSVAFAPIVYGIVIFSLYPYLSTDMSGRHPWDDFMVAMPMMAGVFALQVPFWQGIVQFQLLKKWKPSVRVIVLSLLAVAIWAPFLNMNTLGDSNFLIIAGASAFLAAVVFELGATIWMVALAQAMMGISFVWFHQAMYI